MRAARYYGKEDVRIEHDVAAPPEQLLEGQVRVQPAFVGICGTGMQDHCRWMSTRASTDDIFQTSTNTLPVPSMLSPFPKPLNLSPRAE
jgi:hypothetical protein